ncbi:transmembrane protein 26-like [Acanthaster planci]|uniref:Transmembrane protein 26-like n=1 Tax=Acanthaster planci TaxID=133434 RepID=A0A8B7ZRK9_ACAPL|nr:transmembrane protein 26-like [Acanthaster planci]XP_022107515.1 transmembrane protein 26-like [Acanthaster planci]
MSRTGHQAETGLPIRLLRAVVPPRRPCSTVAWLVSFTKALTARLLFAIHGIVTVWRVASVQGSAVYYLMVMPVALMPGEMIFTLQTTAAGEWKWLCPSALLYLASVVPGLWMLQLDLYQKRMDYRDHMHWKECAININYNQTLFTEIQGLTIPVVLADDEWALALEQILLCLLILGRWLLPKGSLTREQLSQLLMVYIGMAADILEFSLENLREEAVVCNKLIIMVILALWSWSLIQFALVLTSVAGPKIRVFNRRREASTSSERGARATVAELQDPETQHHHRHGCCSSEIWALCISLIMQDGPYLTMRLYLITHFHIINQMMLFFTLKNMMIFLLTVYRIYVLRMTNRRKKKRLQQGVKVRVDPGDGLMKAGQVPPVDLEPGDQHEVITEKEISKPKDKEALKQNGFTELDSDLELTQVVAHVEERMRGKPHLRGDAIEEIEL